MARPSSIATSFHFLRTRFIHPRLYATVEPPVIVARPPPPPHPALAAQHASDITGLDTSVLDALAKIPSSSRIGLPQLIQQYLERSGRILDSQLPYEPTPAESRRTRFDVMSPEDRGVHLIAHCAQEGDRHKITLSSGFAIDGIGERDHESIIVTCAHTLDEVNSTFSYGIFYRLYCIDTVLSTFGASN